MANGEWALGPYHFLFPVPYFLFTIPRIIFEPQRTP